MLKCPDCQVEQPSLQALKRHFAAAHPAKPEVLNARDYSGGPWPPGAVSIMRGSPWGNPYRKGIDGTKEEVIAKYIAEKSADPAFIAAARRELRGRHLMCACKPKACHGDWLLEIANSC